MRAHVGKKGNPGICAGVESKAPGQPHRALATIRSAPTLIISEGQWLNLKYRLAYFGQHLVRGYWSLSMSLALLILAVVPFWKSLFSLDIRGVSLPRHRSRTHFCDTLLLKPSDPLRASFLGAVLIPRPVSKVRSPSVLI